MTIKLGKYVSENSTGPKNSLKTNNFQIQQHNTFQSNTNDQLDLRDLDFSNDIDQASFKMDDNVKAHWDMGSQKHSATVTSNSYMKSQATVMSQVTAQFNDQNKSLKSAQFNDQNRSLKSKTVTSMK